MYLNDWAADCKSGNFEKTVLYSPDERLFFLYGEIDAKNCAEIANDIIKINFEDAEKESKEINYKRKPIKIYFSSFGGSVYDMWLLVDTIEGSATPVYTYCTGYAMSAAFIIFLAGHKRYMSKHATLMYHQIYCWRSGKYQDLVEDRAQMDHLNSMIEKYVNEKTNLGIFDIDEIREKKRDMYFSADLAKKMKIIDEIIDYQKEKPKKNNH